MTGGLRTVSVAAELTITPAALLATPDLGRVECLDRGHGQIVPQGTPERKGRGPLHRVFTRALRFAGDPHRVDPDYSPAQ